MNMKGIVIAVVVVVILGALGYFFFINNQYKTEKPAATTQNQTKQASPSASDSDKESLSVGTISYTTSGFSPQSLTIKSGESVTWTNDSTSSVQVGSANHPTHTANRELTGDQFIIKLAPGESKTVQLNETGEWGYHDHLNSGMTGTIIVE